MPAITFHFSTDQFDLLEQLSMLQNRSKSQQMRQLIEDAAKEANIQPRTKASSNGTNQDHAVTYATISE